VQRELTLGIRNNITDYRLPGVAVGVWAAGRRYVRPFGLAERANGARGATN
jgi:hypothetical protein